MLRNGPVVGALVVLGLLAPGTVSTPTPPPTRSSCKPSVPLAVTLESRGPGRWSVQCSSLDLDREVTVWMWTGDESSRREVWRGRLHPGVTRPLEITFAAPDAAPVWAAVEASSPNGDVLRSMASVAPPGLAQAAKPAGQLLTDPVTGEQVLQFVGQPEAGR